MTIMHKELTDEEKMRICDRTEGCENCVFQGDCDDEGDDEF